MYGEHNLILPPLTNLSLSALQADGIYLVDDGVSLWLVLGAQVDPNKMMDLCPNLRMSSVRRCICS